MSDTPYFTVTEARTASWMGGALTSTTGYASADIDSMREAVEEALEQACAVAFVPRSVTAEQHDGNGTTDLLLDHIRPLTISAATIGTVSLTADQLATIKTYKTGGLYYPSGWTSGRANVTVSYTHGYAVCPGRVKRAAMLLTKRFLLDSPVNDRSTMQVGADGTREMFVTAGVRGAVFDSPEANALVEAYGVQGGQMVG